MAMSKRRVGPAVRSLNYSIDPAKFKEDEFQHHCNPNFDPSFNFGLIIRTSEL